MAIYLRAVNHVNNCLTVVLPQDVMRRRGWDTARYLTIDDKDPDILILRRFDLEEIATGKKPDCPHYPG